ncbi:hydantoinase B/oxoprolinase family protein [Rubidibacter lacunae]|uniref:hydantoinase B/oxoprolinase family protein n=1 Tax=Rubidibacter lacunae TaxID=582514 RepID=UPI00058F8587|nr:hydantoinase B/oxoprolinase family protein [Rubidibacter lacunae]
MSYTPERRWQFWIDRGGTFTDVVARRPDGALLVRKLLSESDRYADAAVQGIREVMGLAPDASLSGERIEVVKMGTTVATNALLERHGDRVVLAITQGLRDALRIGYQNRPDIFARQIRLPVPPYERVVEIASRIDARGNELVPLDRERARADLQAAFDEGIRSCAIALMHGYRYPDRERAIAAIAREIGFTHVSVSHVVSPLVKLVSRGETTVVDAYLSPILHRYVNRVAAQLRATDGQVPSPDPSPRLMFVQSNGGLTDATTFRGKDSILSGPAGGIVGAVKTSAIAGIDKLISFDMGGTSTDVAHYAGEYERNFENLIAGVRLQAPMLDIHTVAAGGGSIARFDGTRYRVGPESAGANPGPAAYGKGGPLTITDCNVAVGKLHADFFPRVFGPDADRPLDVGAVRDRFTQLAAEIGGERAPEKIASGFLAIAIEIMAGAIAKISLERGHDVSKYALCCFGGAGGQHACLLAEALGIERILIHPLAGVLSAYGIGLADVRVLRERSLELELNAENLPELELQLSELVKQGESELERQNLGGERELQILRKVHLKYNGTDAAIGVDFDTIPAMRQQFSTLHRRRYGFTMPDQSLVAATIAVESIALSDVEADSARERGSDAPPQAIATVSMYARGSWHATPVYPRETLQPDNRVTGPAIVVESTTTTVVEPGWQATVTPHAQLLLDRCAAPQTASQAIANTVGGRDLSVPDPVLLEVFNHLFRAIAERMGTTLQNTSYSVNIKERLDFSCAVFDADGWLVANAPHIPVHLGSMSESVRGLMAGCGGRFQPGDVYALNNPYNGGTHLPDITVVTPVFVKPTDSRPQFYVASRGHHADIGGIAPGSMPPFSQHTTEEGILLDNVRLVADGKFCDRELRELLASGPYPARKPDQNVADLKAQIAANERGIDELKRAILQYGLATVVAYVKHVQDNAEESVRRAIGALHDGSFTCELDTGAKICATVSVDRVARSARVDFSGTSPQQPNNFNAPKAICKAAVLYVFRTLVEDDIPLNDGCLKPLDIVVPEGSMLAPRAPAPVVAGNVETSQAIVDALYGALGLSAAAQGTMNNFTFGNAKYQYYETICGGSGAGPEYDGTDAIHTHMTNSRLTDPEVLEWRFPVVVDRFAIRAGSGGSGRHCGGNGTIRHIRFLEPMTAAILSGRRRVVPFGLAGGGAGAPGRNAVGRSDGTVEELGGTAVLEVQTGDTIIIETPGGGGYGWARERSPEAST